MRLPSLLILLFTALGTSPLRGAEISPPHSGPAAHYQGALAGHRPRVIVSTDIGGTDPDDFQSLVHLLLYADVLDLEGLISSPYGPGRRAHILEVLDAYAADYPKLRTHAKAYPDPASLRTLSKQGETEVAPHAGFRSPTEGSNWIVTRARHNDARPLHVLVWGGLEDLAQALHDAPDILPRLRVYFIGGPNKKWSANAYQYLVDHHPRLWIIEANATYRGWFVGGVQQGEWGNREFVRRHVAGQGALGAFFARQLGGTIKMGDTPSLGWLLFGTPSDPSQPGWGGQFVRAWDRPRIQTSELPGPEQRLEIFGILELALPLGADAPRNPQVELEVENQVLPGEITGDGTAQFRFCPKEAKVYTFLLRGNVPALQGRTGGLTVVPTPPDRAQHPSATHPDWWTDDPSPAASEGPHAGARTVNRWREDFLRDFARRLARCTSSAAL